jgi:hypothetical protein
MRRWLAIAALSIPVLAAPLLAQMHGGGSRGGGSMGRGGFSSSGSRGGFSSSVFHGGGSSGVGSRSGASFNNGIHQRSFRSGASFSGFRRPGFSPRRFGNRVFFSTFSPGFFGYYGYPGYYGGDFYSAADYYPSYDYYGSSYYSAQNDITQQQQDMQQQDIDRLENEVASLRERRESQQEETRNAPTPQADSRPVVSTPTLLVFRDKHTQEVQNYAIVGGTLWVFSEQRATKLPLSWLDIEATTKANEDRGIDFQLPK